MFAKKLSFTLVSIIAVALSAYALTAFAQTEAPAQQFGNAPEKPLPTEVQVRVINLATNMVNRTEAAISRFENIIARTESRIAKMKEEGYPTEDAEVLLNEAKTSLERARVQLVDIDKRVADAVSAQDYWAGWFSIRDNFSEAKAILTGTKRNLQDTVSELYLTRDEGIPQGENNVLRSVISE